ncbi:energy-coupling factor ABC transporter ATP-binding protein [Treponema pedis]|uniref:Cobalt ABC transporter ATP-binding protein n=1 Tax=Treponema pedis str. T A4 TaxID=1291379 RepID=S6A918_9SPIR|nr:ABC transporter ATP-binding protein [Treponema pedis]AGT44804.1 cobalt ABC transporter ATP-binding protein [Treponema pedis str. T A4]
MAVLIKDLSYTYPDGRHALKNVNMEFQTGKKTAIVGLNGSGKSTLLYHLNGTILPQTGSVSVLGEEVCKKNLNSIRKKAGFLFDYPDHQLFLTTVYEDIGFGLKNLGKDKNATASAVNKILSELNIDHLKDYPPYQLSLGQKKICAIAGILVMQPEIIICDEPFSGLDSRVKENFKNILDDFSAKGKTIIFSTHDQEFCYEWADNIFIMNKGEIIASGETVNIFNNKEILEKAGLVMPKLARLFGNRNPAPRNVEEALNPV